MVLDEGSPMMICPYCKIKVRTYRFSKKRGQMRHTDDCIEKIVLQEQKGIKEGWIIPRGMDEEEKVECLKCKFHKTYIESRRSYLYCIKTERRVFKKLHRRKCNIFEPIEVEND